MRPDHRGRGLGSALLTEATRLLAENGHRAVELSVADADVRAAALYRRLGWAEVGAGADAGPNGPKPWTRMRLVLSR